MCVRVSLSYGQLVIEQDYKKYYFLRLFGLFGLYPKWKGIRMKFSIVV